MNERKRVPREIGNNLASFSHKSGNETVSKPFEHQLVSNASEESVGFIFHFPLFKFELLKSASHQYDTPGIKA